MSLIGDLLLHVLATYCAWFVVTQSNLPLWAPYREQLQVQSTAFNEWTNCPMCSGFWCSLVLVLLRLAPCYPLAPLTVGFAIVLCLAGATGVFFLETLVRRFEAR